MNPMTLQKAKLARAQATKRTTDQTEQDQTPKTERMDIVQGPTEEREKQHNQTRKRIKEGTAARKNK